MPGWTIDWKRGPLSVDLPDEPGIEPIRRRQVPNRGPWRQLVAEAIAHPIGTPPLREIPRPSDRVAFLVTDMQDEIIGKEGIGDLILDELNAAGVPDSSVTLIHAAGMHGHPAGRKKIGDELIGRVGRYVEHDPFDEANLTFLGVTRLGTPVWINRWAAEADFVLGLGQCSPSLYGYQGGAGIILPGIAGADTVRYNHQRILTTRTNSTWGPGNPMREDVMDVGDLAKLRFKIDCAQNAVFAGYFREEWPVGVRYNEEHLLPLVEPGDIYVFSGAGSAPMINSIYMGIESAVRCTKANGVVIAIVSGHAHPCFPPRPLAETMEEFLYATRRWCETPPGDPMHPYWHMRDNVCKTELMARNLEEISRVIARHQGEPRSTTHVWSHRRSVEARRCILVSEGIPPADGKQMGFIATYDNFDAAYRHARDLVGAGSRTLVNLPPDAAIPYVQNPCP